MMRVNESKSARVLKLLPTTTTIPAPFSCMRPWASREEHFVKNTMISYRRRARSPTMAMACLLFALAGLASVEARLPIDRATIDERGRTLKDISQSIFQGADAFQRGLKAHSPTSSSSPAASPSPTASMPPGSPSQPPSPSGSGSSKSSPASDAPISYKPSTTRAPVSGGKGMMMPSGKAGGKGMMVMTKAPALPPKTKTPHKPPKSKAPAVPKTKAPAIPKSKKSKAPVAPKSKSKSKEAKKKLPKSPSSKSKKSSKSKSKISAPTAPPQTKPPTTTVAPSSSSSSTTQPAAPSASSPSPAPIPGGPSSVTLTLYQIGYVVSLTYIPSTAEVEGVVNVTQQFLSDFFQNLYSNMVGFETIKVSDRLMLNAPYEIVYNSTIDFAPGTTVPSVDELNSELQSAFTGDTKTSYLSLLSGLGPDNIFSQTTDVVFTFIQTTQDAATGQSYGDALSSTALAAIGAGALAIVVSVAATVHYFRHRNETSRGEKGGFPQDDFATRADVTESSVRHDASTATGDTHSCMSPRSTTTSQNEEHDTEEEDDNGHRNPRVAYRLSFQALEPSEGGAGSAFSRRGSLRPSLSFEGDDELYIGHASSADELASSHSAGVTAPLSDGNGSCGRRHP